jgi:hypothetical protein
MQLGNFKESSSNIVEITGSPDIFLQANTSQILKTKIFVPFGGDGAEDAERMHSILDLMEAAVYFH